jgi:hypothetical protein
VSQLSFQYPGWYIVLCAVLGALYAAVLYYNDQTFKETHPRMHQALGLLRFLSGTLLAILLLSPVLKSILTEIKKPQIVILQDQSESVAVGLKDSIQYKANMEALVKSIDPKKFEVFQYAFGDHVREGIDFQYKDKISNLSDAMNKTYDVYSGQHLAGVILATDGIYNEGSDPLYAVGKLNIPIYTIALGDTTPKKDLVVKKVYHNNIAYLGDKFNIQIDLSATNCTNNNTSLTVSKLDAAGNATNVNTSVVNINKNDFFNTKEVTLEASQVGIQKFRISASPVPDEVTNANNIKDIYVEVLDARTKILLLANSPHPDIAALNDAIGNNKNYNLTVGYLNDLKVNPAEFDFVVLHQIPSMTNGADAVLTSLNTKRIPRLFIVGGQSDLRKLTAAQNLVAISADGKNSNDVQGILNPNFNLFTIEEGFKQIPSFNPISAPFGDFKETGSGQTLLYQKIGKVETKFPLITLGETNGIKTGIICAEGLWRWRLFDFMQHQNHEIFDNLLSKCIQYVSVKEDKRKFRVTMEKTLFKENEAIQFNAELYNNTYELINEPDASLVVTGPDKKQSNYTFSKNGKSYSLSVGILPVGNYTYKGAVNANGQQMSAEGQFSIQAIQQELYETTANHGVLRALSNQSGATMVMPNQIASLADIINKKEIKPMLFQTNKTQSVINLKWIFFLLLSMLCLEWFGRRYFGSY